jgi:prolipoprotein diacylglyceryltransferase
MLVCMQVYMKELWGQVTGASMAVNLFLCVFSVSPCFCVSQRLLLSHLKYSKSNVASVPSLLIKSVFFSFVLFLFFSFSSFKKKKKKKKKIIIG